MHLTKTLFLILALYALALAGCANINAPIVGENDSAPIGFARLNWKTGKNSRIEGNIAGTKGDWEFHVREGTKKEWHDRTFVGPVDLSGNADITWATLKFRQQYFPSWAPIGIEFGLGGAIANSRIEVESIAEHEFSISSGVGGGVFLSEEKSRFGLRGNMDLYLIGVNGYSSHYELLGTYRPIPNWEFMAGLQGLSLWFEEHPDSDVRLSYSGPTLGVSYSF